jgi:hypothetical protein
VARAAEPGAYGYTRGGAAQVESSLPIAGKRGFNHLFCQSDKTLCFSEKKREMAQSARADADAAEQATANKE